MCGAIRDVRFGPIADIADQGRWCDEHQMKKVIKRYARTHLYDTQEARYVTISDLREWVAKGLEFVVIDADTGDDITKYWPRTA
jgi:hypothetical protein